MFCEALTQVVEEEGAQRLENVRLARVVLTEFATGLGGLDSLEERSEDGGADVRPVEGARTSSSCIAEEKLGMLRGSAKIPPLT